MKRPSRKIILLFLAFFLALVLTAGVVFYFGSQRSISINSTDNQEKNSENKKVATNVVVEDKDTETEEEEEKPFPKKEFTDFGDFWIEVHTDDLDMKVPIVDGVGKDDLKRGVGRHKTSALPNSENGNMVVSGHRWIPGRNPSYTAFRHIDKLKIGDKVSVFHGEKEYVYKVRETKTVSGDAVEILEQTDAPQLTLYTCTPLFTALRRLVYIADFVEVRNT